MNPQNEVKRSPKVSTDFRLQASPFITKKAMEYMEKEGIRKRSDLVFKALAKLIGL